MIFGALADKAPRSRFIAALPLGFLVVLLGNISFDCVNAHGHVVSPRSRNWLAHSSQEGREPGQGTSTTPLVEYTPQGIFRLQSSGRCGLSPNGNQYDAPKNVLGGILPPKIQATYVKGQQIDLEVVLTAHHKGHFTYSACALSAGQTTATQQCFDANKLMFVNDNLYGAPKDSRYPDRAYIPLTSYPGLQIVPNIGGGTAYKFNHRFQLPAGLSGDVVLIQWTYWTANSCIYPGYRTMSWPANYYDQGGLPDCAMTDFSTYLGGSIPELFWNCVEVKILNTPAPAPVPAPLPAPQPTSTSCNVIEENTDYTKSDICTTCPKSSTAEGCCSICAKTVGCGAYTWTNFNGGTCWLKSSKIGSIACTGCRSATMKTPAPFPVPVPVPAPKPVPVPSPESSSCSAIEENIDYTKADICTNCPASPTAEGCCSICAKTVGCGAYTWTNFNGGTCWLKSSKIGSIACTGCRSATIKSPAPIPVPVPVPAPKPVPVPSPQSSSCSTIEENTDYTKADICTTCPASPTAEGCCSICAKTVGCGAYTWTNFNGGTCWLKSSKIGSIACTGCRSATIKGPAPIPVPAPAPIPLPVPAGGTLIPQWQTCRKNIDWCDPNWTCCVAPADVGTGKTTCRPACCGNCADTSTSTFKTLNLLNRVSGSQVVSGQHNDGKKGIDWAWYTNKVKEKTGKYPGLYSADFVWGTDHSFAVQEAIRQWNAGAIINFMWHQCPPRPGFSSGSCQWEGTSSNSYAVLSTLTDSEWNSLITDGSSWNVEYKKRMDFIAGYLKTLKSNGVEVMFRPLHEMNQGRFWWGGRTGASGTRRLYQITRDYMVNTHGLNNLIWVWNVQDLSSNYWEYNPGSNYFDVASLDIYSNGFWDDQFYQALLNEAGNKPVGIGESFEVPSVSYLNGHTRWSFFMVWADEGFFADNYSRSQTLADVQATYGSSRVLTRENLNRG